METLRPGVLTVGSDISYPPFEYRQGGEVTGFDIDLISEIASRLGLKAEFVNTPFDTLFTQLAAGRFDVVISSAFITPEREEEVDFSDPYFKAEGGLVINTEAEPTLDSIEALGTSDSVGVLSGGVWQQWAKGALVPKGVDVRVFSVTPDAYTALEAGQVTAVIDDEPSAMAEIQDRPTLKVTAAVDTGEVYGIGVDPANGPLLAAVNRVLAVLVSDGTYARIYARYALGSGGSIASAG